MNRRLTKLLTSVLVITSLLVTGCSSTKNDKTDTSKNTKNTSQTAPKTMDLKGKKPIVTIEMQDGGKITAELYPDIAPVTVSNFVTLIQKGFYDGLKFHRVLPGFMIQGGDPSGDGTGGPGYSISGEFTSNGFTNTLKHTRGVLSMARSKDANSAGSQFFIMVADAPTLDGEYASFGKVTSGMEEVDKIVNTEAELDQSTGENSKPKTPQVMKKVTVEIK